MYFTREEKLVTLHALNEILIADGEVTNRETDIMNSFLTKFSCRLSDVIEAKNMDISLVAKIINGMSQEKKEFFKGAISHMALADGDDKDLNVSVQRVASIFFTFAK